MPFPGNDVPLFYAEFLYKFRTDVIYVPPALFFMYIILYPL